MSGKKGLSRVQVGLVFGIPILLSLILWDGVCFPVIFTLLSIFAFLEIEPLFDDVQVAYWGYLTLLIVIILSGAVSAYVLDWKIVFLVITTVSTVDIMAYVFGSRYGGRFFRTRPFPKTSKKKSWEGLLAGWGAGILTGVALCLLMSQWSWKNLMFILIALTAAVIGDYMGSYVKRLAGIKDSGDALLERHPYNRLIKVIEAPLSSHGGYLDRIGTWSVGLTLVMVAQYAINFLTS